MSANPTGPLHVGHGRGAAYGSAVSSLLTERALKFIVNIMSMMPVAKWIFWPPVFGCVTLKLAAKQLVFPSNGYKGAYVSTLLIIKNMTMASICYNLF